MTSLIVLPDSSTKRMPLASCATNLDLCSLVTFINCAAIAGHQKQFGTFLGGTWGDKECLAFGGLAS